MIKCSPRWQREEAYTHLLLQELQNYDWLLINHQQENVRSQQKKLSHVRAKEKPQQDWQEGKLTFQSQTPYPPEMFRGLTQNLCAVNPTETEADLSLGVPVSPADIQVSSHLLQGLWVQQTRVRHLSPLGEGHKCAP